MPDLLAGCGANTSRRLHPNGRTEWVDLVTLDFNDEHNPDVVHDLRVLPYPFDDDTFDEIHLYEVLEHLGQQGDYQAFFGQFSEFWRILKPFGLLVATSPAPSSPWAWGDPGHTRVMGPECLTYLDQTEYASQVGKTAMTDYRFCYRADFALRQSLIQRDRDHIYMLEAVKPSRGTHGKDIEAQKVQAERA